MDQAGFDLTNGPIMPTFTSGREQTFQFMRAKMGHLEEVIEDLGQFMCDNQLEDHFLSYVLRLSNISKDLGAEMKTVENYLEFMKTHNVPSSSTTGYFSVVPDEVVLYVFSYLSELELCMASLVCKEWNNLTSDDALWRSLYTKYWGIEAVARALNNQATRPRPLPTPASFYNVKRHRFGASLSSSSNNRQISTGDRGGDNDSNGGRESVSADRGSKPGLSRRNSMARRLSSLWNPTLSSSAGISSSSTSATGAASQPVSASTASYLAFVDAHQRSSSKEYRDANLSAGSSKVKSKHGKSKKKSKKKGKLKNKLSKRMDNIDAETGYLEGEGGINHDLSPRGRDCEGGEMEEFYDDGDSGGDEEPSSPLSRSGGVGFKCNNYGVGRYRPARLYQDDDGCGDYDDVRWKELFVKYHQTKRNWDTGKHNLDTLTHHKNTVRCVQFDENYNMISASDDKTIQRLDWDAEKGMYIPKMKLVGHEGGIICMQFDGNRMITGSRDKTLRLWDIEKGQTLSIFKNHTGQVWCLQFDEHKIVSGSDDKRLNVWDINSGKLITSLHGHSWGIGCLQFDDKKIISGAADKTMKIWDMGMMQCRHTLKGHKSSVRCLQFDEQRIVSGSWDNTLKIWDVHTHKCVDTLQGHTNKLMCLQFDDTKIISGAQDKTLRVWDIHTTACMAILKSHTDSLCDLYFDDTKLVSGSRDKTVKVWDFS